jgi:hypothetical protein
MKTRKFLARAAGTAFLPVAVLFGSANSAHALAVYFTPPGTQIDSDNISEIPGINGGTQAFDFYLDVPTLATLGGGTFIGYTPTEFTYDLAFDGPGGPTNEWSPQASSLAACNSFGGGGICSALPAGNPGGGLTNPQIRFVLKDVGGLAPIIATGVNPYKLTQLGPLVGNLGVLVNDGFPDLQGTLKSLTLTSPTGVKTTLSQANNWGGFSKDLSGSQVVEMQPGSSVPGPLPLLGAGAAFGYSRRLRNRVKLAGGSPVKA